MVCSVLIVYFYFVLFLVQGHVEKTHLSESATLYKYIWNKIK